MLVSTTIISGPQSFAATPFRRIQGRLGVGANVQPFANRVDLREHVRGIYTLAAQRFLETHEYFAVDTASIRCRAAFQPVVQVVGDALQGEGGHVESNLEPIWNLIDLSLSCKMGTPSSLLGYDPNTYCLVFTARSNRRTLKSPFKGGLNGT